ncbi:PhzF family phenazine biosynthesis protein [Rhodalgimonas zhirmunskyi]|uniref:PhzF family phenazine biosynthesis protein n=1 Tax=Rhodalgimonas zhirmunskyi TaxID=2964767 RepID=A0AAJ1UCB8_9RHOB|nr:PhzF family phenazine biosynthesis protein [Rhodoalgimonas zhirmunskyi]MDQ2095278.1 PhzF family phenazine biosynthesis protein [Rhodoalgimonas zhirmunskyi]
MTRYLTLDVFTDVPFGGNPLAVIPDARALPGGALQKIAREFNYSETTFVFPPADPAHTARVRIFTPTMEVPFAGHPTIGTGVALAHAGHGPDMVLELGIGPIAVRAAGDTAEFTTHAPLDVLAHPTLQEVAAALSLAETEIETTTHSPIMAGVGLAFTLTELKSRAALASAQPDIAAFRAGAARYPDGLDFAQFCYWRGPDAIHTRMFAPLDNIPEDPATGSAAAAFGALLADLKGPQDLSVLQGEDMGRPSRIGVRAESGSVTISGAAQLMMEGRIITPR